MFLIEIPAKFTFDYMFSFTISHCSDAVVRQVVEGGCDPRHWWRFASTTIRGRLQYPLSQGSRSSGRKRAKEVVQTGGLFDADVLHPIANICVNRMLKMYL